MCTVDKIGDLRGGDRMCAGTVAAPIDAEIAVKGHSYSETHPSRVAPDNGPFSARLCLYTTADLLYVLALFDAEPEKRTL